MEVLDSWLTRQLFLARKEFARFPASNATDRGLSIKFRLFGRAVFRNLLESVRLLVFRFGRFSRNEAKRPPEKVSTKNDNSDRTRDNKLEKYHSRTGINVGEQLVYIHGYLSDDLSFLSKT